MQNFKANSHIPVYPLQPRGLKSFRMGKYLSSAWLTQKSMQTAAKKGVGVYSRFLGSLYRDPHLLCPNIYIYHFHAKDNLITHCSRKQLNISLCIRINEQFPTSGFMCILLPSDLGEVQSGFKK